MNLVDSFVWGNNVDIQKFYHSGHMQQYHTVNHRNLTNPTSESIIENVVKSFFEATTEICHKYSMSGKQNVPLIGLRLQFYPKYILVYNTSNF